MLEYILKALNKTVLINNLSCWICCDWGQSVCVALFSRQLQSALFEAEDQNITFDLINPPTGSVTFTPHWDNNGSAKNGKAFPLYEKKKNLCAYDNIVKTICTYTDLHK